jgi:hypothetical protein
MRLRCTECPFRNDQRENFQLGEKRVREITYAVPFIATKPLSTTVAKIPTERTTAAVRGSHGAPAQSGQAQRHHAGRSTPTGYDAGVIDRSPVYSSIEEAIAAHTWELK